MVKTIGIVGGGTVGHATARSYVEFSEVKVYDTLRERRTHDLAEVMVCDIVFVCLPTPQLKDGSCDTSVLDAFFAQRVFREETGANMVLRSTVPVGYTREAARKFGLTNLVHSPEFLTARCAVVDAQIPARNVIGFSQGDYRSKGLVTDFTPYSGGTLKVLGMMYQDRFPGVPVHIMSSDESEAVKLIQNSFFAVKVALFNEFQEFCAKSGLEWTTVRATILADGRISPSHTQVPGPDGKFGFGGACLPKDLANFIRCQAQAGSDYTLTLATQTRNIDDRERTQ